MCVSPSGRHSLILPVVCYRWDLLQLTYRLNPSLENLRRMVRCINWSYHHFHVYEPRMQATVLCISHRAHSIIWCAWYFGYKMNTVSRSHVVSIVRKLEVCNFMADPNRSNKTFVAPLLLRCKKISVDALISAYQQILAAWVSFLCLLSQLFLLQYFDRPRRREYSTGANRVGKTLSDTRTKKCRQLQ